MIEENNKIASVIVYSRFTSWSSYIKKKFNYKIDKNLPILAMKFFKIAFIYLIIIISLMFELTLFIYTPVNSFANKQITNNFLDKN